jgi:hypothetical protein
VRLVRRSIDATALDLAGATVLTEAATGAYAVTPTIAALGGADTVVAVTKESRYGTVAEVAEQTHAIADLAGVSERITIESKITPEIVAAADVVTNSGHLRPIDAQIANWMRPGAVVPLMFEAWEIDLGRDDVDLEALRDRGVRFAGTNERHPEIDVFSYLAPMAVALLTVGAISARGSRLLVLCDNPFMPYLQEGLSASGAHVVAAASLSEHDLDDDLDAIVVALSPTGAPVLNDDEVALIAERSPAAVLLQFWGDLPRASCASLGVPCVPVEPPRPGHMGILPSAIGPEPVVRLQTGGLKVASILLVDEARWHPEDRSYLDEV